MQQFPNSAFISFSVYYLSSRPYWSPEFKSRCHQGDNCGEQFRDFLWVFLGLSRFPNSNILHFSIPPLHVTSYSHSFILCHPSPHSSLGNIVGVTHHRCIIIVYWFSGLSGAHSIKLSYFEYIVYYRMGRGD